jgi:UPF0271 protein
MQNIDLNADIGEGFGPWTIGSDADLMGVITSANIACGFHAGDPDTMAQTIDLALKNGVALGAHPGFSDLQGFGRRRMHLPEPSLANMIQYQLGALSAMAQARGAPIAHFKLHGALSNMAAESLDMARTCYAAALALHPGIRLVVMPNTALEAAARDLNAPMLAEVFADRAYTDSGALLDRSQPGAMIHDPQTAADRMVAMLQTGCITSHTGRRIPTQIDTICVHGDNANALQTARSVRAALQTAGHRFCSPSFSA